LKLTSTVNEATPYHCFFMQPNLPSNIGFFSFQCALHIELRMFLLASALKDLCEATGLIYKHWMKFISKWYLTVKAHLGVTDMTFHHATFRPYF